MHDTMARLRDAVNAHDPSAMVELIAPEYRSEQPAHPNRGFSGRDQVHKNWSTLFAGVPDLSVEVLRHLDDGHTAWSEWDFRGHHTDGTVFNERGVRPVRARRRRQDHLGPAYMEVVEQGGADIDETMRQTAKVSP